jgi:hypothetical protein
MNSGRDATGQAHGGLPHSETPGSPIARISPGLFAACHVLHRLSVPRHPPDALTSRLIASPSHQGETASPPRTGPNPVPTSVGTESPRKRGPIAAVSHEDTSSDTSAASSACSAPTGEARLRPKGGPSAARTRTCPPRSHHKRSLHPSISHCRGRPRRLCLGTSPNALGRQSFASPVVPLGAALLRLSAGEALLRRWWR